MSNSVTGLTYQIELVQKDNLILQQEVSKQTVLLESSQREITNLKKKLGYYEKIHSGALYEDCKKEICYDYANLKENYYKLLHEHEKNKTQYYNRENDKTLDTWSLEHMYMVNIV